jgi:cell division protein FtsA
MRKKRQKTITGLDIGTTKICAIQGQLDEEGQLTVLGVGSNPSLGLKKGMVVDIEATVDSIQKAVHKCEQMAGVEIRDVYVGIAGGHITSQNSRGVVEVQNSMRGVTEMDRNRALDKARFNVSVPKDLEILHAIPQEYVVDGQTGIKNPVGMSCSTLEVRVHLVLAAIASASNIVKCINHAGLRTREILLESLASSLATLSDNERDLGVLLIDIGGGTSDVAVFTGGSVKFSGVIPLGGDNITNDIAYGLKISRHDAENVKKKYASALVESVESDEMIEVTEVLKDSRTTANRRFLCEIAEARLEQIFMMAKQMVDSSPVRNKIYAGVVLTGGTSLMDGIGELAERIFEMPAKMGVPRGIKGMSGVVSSPIYSTGIGLVSYGLTNEPVGAHYYSNGNVFRKVAYAFKRFIDWYS